MRCVAPRPGLAGGPDAAVDGDDGTGDVGGAAAAEEDRDAGHVVGPADAVGADMRRKDSVLPWASLASIQLNPSGELSSCHSAGVRR